MLLAISLILAAAVHGQITVTTPECVSFDTLHNRYLVSSFTSGSIAQIDSNGQVSTFTSGLGRAYSHQIVDTLIYISSGHSIEAFSLNTAEVAKFIPIVGSVQLDGMAADTSGNLYVTDYTYGDPNPDRIYKIQLSDDFYSVFITETDGLSVIPQDIIFDAKFNRLLVVGYSPNAPIQAISLPDGTITNVADPPVGNFDGIAMDRYRNVYISSWNPNTVYRYDSNFTQPPELLYTGARGVANISVNNRDNILALPLFDLNQVVFYDLNLQLRSDTTYGWAPLNILFEGSTIHPVSQWNWDFGDGGSSLEQSPNHLFETPGIHNVTAQIDVEGGGTYSEALSVYILADSLTALDAEGDPGAQVEVVINARNNAPLNKLVIPVVYSGTLNLHLDSASTAGCRSAAMDHFAKTYADSLNWKVEYTVWNDAASPNDLNPGYGPILKLYFTISSLAEYGQISTITLEGFSARLPKFYGPNFNYQVRTQPGEVSTPGVCGDANSDMSVNIKDITFLINYLYKSGPPPATPDLADVNNSGNVNIQDVTFLITHLYKGGAAPNCS